MPEVLAEAGVYFDPEVATSIASALRKLVLNASLRECLAKLAWRKALTYSWERCAQDTFAFIAQVARNHINQQYQSPYHW